MPRIYVIGGPNGAGKTTAALRILPELVNCREFVNADQIARGLSAFQPEGTAFEAGRLMLKRLEELAAERVDFAFESTLAARSFGPWLRQLQARGYRVHIHFVWVDSPELALARVMARVRSGGHRILPGVVFRRYRRSRENFVSIYSILADEWKVYDNTSAAPELAASGRGKDRLEVWNNDFWQHFIER